MTYFRRCTFVLLCLPFWVAPAYSIEEGIYMGPGGMFASVLKNDSNIIKAHVFNASFWVELGGRRISESASEFIGVLEDRVEVTRTETTSTGFLATTMTCTLKEDLSVCPPESFAEEEHWKLLIPGIGNLSGVYQFFTEKVVVHQAGNKIFVLVLGTNDGENNSVEAYRAPLEDGLSTGIMQQILGSPAGEYDLRLQFIDEQGSNMQVLVENCVSTALESAGITCDNLQLFLSVVRTF